MMRQMSSGSWASYQAAAEVPDYDAEQEPSDGCSCLRHDPEEWGGGPDMPCTCYGECRRHCKGPDPVCRTCEKAAVDWWGDMCERCLKATISAYQAMRAGQCVQCGAEILVSDDTPDVCADCYAIATYPDVTLTEADRAAGERFGLRWVR